MAFRVGFLNQHPDETLMDPYVAPTGQRSAESLFETWVLAELDADGRQRRSVLVNRVANLWLRDELKQGAANVDAGLWGPRRIQREVESLLGELEGDFVRTSPAEPANEVSA